MSRSQAEECGSALAPFPYEALAEPFQTRGPVVHVKAIRALARVSGRHPRLRRKELPEDGSFGSLVAGGLIDERGRLTDNGLSVAQAMTDAPVRIRVQASVAMTPLVFEAHIFGGRALILATPAPARYAAGLASLNNLSTDGVSAPRPSPRVGLDMDTLGRVPIAIAGWAGLQASDAEPARRTDVATWEQVQDKFDADRVPHGAHPSIWAHPWTGFAISTQPATSTLMVISAGGHYYALSRPDANQVHLTWLPPVAFWNEIVTTVRGVTSGSV